MRLDFISLFDLKLSDLSNKYFPRKGKFFLFYLFQGVKLQLSQYQVFLADF